MDRQGQLIAIGAALVCWAASTLAQAPVALREAGWLAHEGRLEALSSEPMFDREALFAAAASSPLAAQYQNPEQLRADLLVGEALFKTPLLFGGQAAKAGISCHSCHVNGRDNPHFQFPAISGAPGTADTTHSFFSETLGNGVFDPVTIPDLARSGKVSHDLGARDLEQFISTIVVGEFAGPEPVRGVIGPLATFVRALRWSVPTTADQRQPRTAANDLADARMMIEQARKQLADGNGALGSLLIAGGRHRLSLVHERLLPGEHDAARAALKSLSQSLGDLQEQLRNGRARADSFDPALTAWQQAQIALARRNPVGSETLYDPARLALHLRE